MPTPEITEALREADEYMGGHYMVDVDALIATLARLLRAAAEDGEAWFCLGFEEGMDEGHAEGEK